MFDELIAAGATFASAGPGQLVITLGIGVDQPDVSMLVDPFPDDDPLAGRRREITATDVVDHALHAPAGPASVAMLTAITGLPLNEYDEVAVMQAWARQTAHTEARTLAAAVPAAEHPLAGSFGAQEVAAAQGITVTAADRMLTLARRLAAVLTDTAAALLDGTVTVAAARVIAEATYGLTPALARQVEARVLERAGRIHSGLCATRPAKPSLRSHRRNSNAVTANARNSPR